MKQKHLLSLKDYSRTDIEEIFGLARKMKSRPADYRKALDGKALAMIFQKPSTRTRVSFEAGLEVALPARLPRMQQVPALGAHGLAP